MAKSDDESFLYFENITEKYDDPTGWVTVARFDSFNECDCRYLFSALASNNQTTRAHLFSECEWDVHADDFGYPYFSDTDERGFSLGNSVSIGDNIIESFMIFRTFHSLFPDTFEPIQNFILYHKLIHDREKASYVEPISTDPVIRYINSKYVQIKIEHLKDYLAARKMILVRFHAHQRQVARPITEIIGKPNDSRMVKNDSRLYMANIYAVGGKTHSRLFGKDIITPYNEPRHRDYLFLTKKYYKYANFIWKVDDDGNPVEDSCAWEQAPSDFLRPIYFKKDVLRKYYDNPRIYEVTDGIIAHLDLWSIPYGQNEHGLVTVWLGDLGHIPYKEQLHWKQYNVTPEGSIGGAFYKRQLMAEFAESDDPVHIIIQLREQINRKFQKTFGFPLFRELSEDDHYVLSTLHSLTTNEQKEFDEQILYLAKGFIDSLDKKSLKSKTHWIPKDSNDNTTFNYLEHFLHESTSLEPSDISRLIIIFRTIQALRSLSAAHIKSVKYNTYLTNVGLDTFGLQKRFLIIAHVFSEQLKKLLSISENFSH